MLAYARRCSKCARFNCRHVIHVTLKWHVAVNEPLRSCIARELNCLSTLLELINTQSAVSSLVVFEKAWQLSLPTGSITSTCCCAYNECRVAGWYFHSVHSKANHQQCKHLASLEGLKTPAPAYWRTRITAGLYSSLEQLS